MKVVISSGHGKYIRGASGIIDEVDEARLVVERVASNMRGLGVNTITFHDNTSQDQDTNLATIVGFHNGQGPHDLDVSVHFNAYLEQGETTNEPKGCEVFYESSAGMEVADEVVDAICEASGLKNRGPKEGNLYFTSNTNEVAILIEVCFLDSYADCAIYAEQFDAICMAIALSIAGKEVPGPSPGPSPEPEPDQRTLGKGDEGPDVVRVQTILGIPADGDFGSITDAAVRAFQGAMALVDDGIVGPLTWDALDTLDAQMISGSNGLPAALELAIFDLAEASPLNSYSYKDRGKPPAGFTAGVCCVFALAAIWLRDLTTDAVKVMAEAETNDTDVDALAYLQPQFDAVEMSNDVDGINTLRHLFVLLAGLAMRESSGRYCEGIDASAGDSSMSADTCEAGLCQTSWNIRSADLSIPELFDSYYDNPNGFRPTFAIGVNPSAANLECYGNSGEEGVAYQWLAKYSPAFALMTTAVGLRTRRQHWGPIGRREVEILPAWDDLLLDVQRLIAV